MPRKDTSRIRTLLVRLDLDKPDEAASYERYAERAANGLGAQWLRNALLNEIESAITQNPPLKVKVIAREQTGDGAITVTVEPQPVIVPVKVDVSDSTLAKPKAEPSPDKAKVTSPTPLPPGYAPRQKTSVFSSSVRPIPAFVGRKSE